MHQGLVNNQWDTIGHWGARSLKSPDVLRRQKKFKGRYTTKTPPTPITIVAAVKSPSNVTHELVLYAKTTRYQNMIRRKELPKSNKAQMRCVQCRKEGRKDVFTKWVCMGCAYLPLCNALTKGRCNKIASRNIMMLRRLLSCRVSANSPGKWKKSISCSSVVCVRCYLFFNIMYVQTMSRKFNYSLF